MPALTGISLGGGIIGNLLNSITRGKEIGNLQSAEKRFAKLSPEQLSGLVSRAEQPLSQDLLNSVGNTVQADMASRGLAEAPGIFAQTETQTLAPYKLQQQQMALQLIMRQFGLPIEYAQAILQGLGGGSNLGPLMMALMLGRGQGGSGGSSGISLPADTGPGTLDDIFFGGLGTPPTVPSTTPSLSAPSYGLGPD
jgi:hypothetical protein